MAKAVKSKVFEGTSSKLFQFLERPDSRGLISLSSQLKWLSLLLIERKPQISNKQSLDSAFCLIKGAVSLDVTFLHEKLGYTTRLGALDWNPTRR